MGGTFSYLFSSTTRKHSSQTASQDVTDSEPHKKVKKVIRQKIFTIQALITITSL